VYSETNQHSDQDRHQGHRVSSVQTYQENAPFVFRAARFWQACVILNHYNTRTGLPLGFLLPFPPGSCYAIAR
jgi:hypothetical protein